MLFPPAEGPEAEKAAEEALLPAPKTTATAAKSYNAAQLKALKEAVKQAEKTITDTEEAIERQEALMASPEVYSNPEKAAAAAKEYQRLKDALAQAYTDWEEAEEALAEATEG